MNERDLKNTIQKKMRLENEKSKYDFPQEIEEIITSMNNCEIWIEETSVFSKREWNTYSAILHIKVPLEKEEIFKKHSKEIWNVADSIYGKVNDCFLTHINIDLLPEINEVIDLSNISISETTKKAIEESTQQMRDGKYNLVIDRVHTALHGYLRYRLDRKGISYQESDTLSQLYNKLHSSLDRLNVSEYNDLVKTIIRSMSGVISSINDLRNRYSLSHPNETIVSEREAKLAIDTLKIITDYLEHFE
jgi:HEPN domain-containing protein